jgi:uncharacterized SAM-binding protein YcdF (DUF218 family)
MLRWVERLLAGIALLVVATVLAVLVTYETVPTRNTRLTHFDTVLVLGCPAQLNGQPSAEERARVSEGVKEFKAGRAGHILFSGGPTENSFVEGQVMAVLAEQMGVPAADVVVEGKSQDTVQNIYFSYKLMQQRGWKSAEVISSFYHLPRAGLILQRYPFAWREQGAPLPPHLGFSQVVMIYESEALYTTQLRWFGIPASPYVPEASKGW